ncbi:MAG: hypothetical protein L0I06_02675, partial [Acidipropionibacterium jensenii]|nr:hypothetical protein [Acidipropionibacterium jensenii]
MRTTDAEPFAGGADALEPPAEAEGEPEELVDDGGGASEVAGSEGVGDTVEVLVEGLVQAPRRRRGIAAMTVRRPTIQAVYRASAVDPLSLRCASSQRSLPEGATMSEQRAAGEGATRSFAADVFGPGFELVDHRGPGDWIPLSAMSAPPVLRERVENTRLAIRGVGTSPRQIRAVASTMALG